MNTSHIKSNANFFFKISEGILIQKIRKDFAYFLVNLVVGFILYISMLRTCPNMTMAVKREFKPQL